MAWSKIQDNSRRASTGASMSSFVRKNGSSKTTCLRSAALAKSLMSSASPMQPFFSGYASTEYNAGQYLKQEKLSIGGQLGRITQCGTGLENSIPTGAAVSQQIAKRSTQAKSGKLRAAWYGREIRQPARDAASSMMQVSPSTFTTSHPSRSRNFGQRHQTCCLFVSLATNGFIQEGM